MLLLQAYCFHSESDFKQCDFVNTNNLLDALDGYLQY